MAVRFEGRFIELPWYHWRGVKLSPDCLITLSGRRVHPAELDLLLWKAAFYDRGRRDGDDLHKLFPEFDAIPADHPDALSKPRARARS